MNGYDVERFVHPEPLVAMAFCSICQAIARNAVVSYGGSSDCEAHVFCAACIDHWRPQVCPNCKQDPGSFIAAPYQNREIRNAQYKCAHAGCTHITALKRMPEHEARCPYQLVPCPLACGLSVLRSALAAHEQGCVRRLAPCRACARPVPLSEHDSHKDTCEAESVRCPHCDHVGPRGQLDTHWTTCADFPVCCFFPDCQEILPRHQMATHSPVHLQSLFVRLQVLEQRMLPWTYPIHLDCHPHPVVPRPTHAICHECGVDRTPFRCTFDQCVYHVCTVCAIVQSRNSPTTGELRERLQRACHVNNLHTGDPVTRQHAAHPELLGMRVSRPAVRTVPVGAYSLYTRLQSMRTRGTVVGAGPTWLRVRWDTDEEELVEADHDEFTVSFV